MRQPRAGLLAACCLAALMQPLAAASATSDDDALSLQASPSMPAPKASPSRLRAFGELAAGRLSQRYGLPAEDARRASLDLTWEYRFNQQWRTVISDRLDDVHPVDEGSRATLNSLRELYVGWQDAAGVHAVDLGRVNVRYGPAYGFNPTDYFRDGASRAVTTADPLALRDNRLGTAMLRVQRLWSGGSASLILAPKLRDAPSQESFSVDLGATNHADRALLTVSTQPAQSVSLQLFAFHEQNKGVQLGANATALVGDAVVAFAEWSGGRDHDLLSAALDPVAKVVTRHRAALGMTYTTPSRLALTAEFEYNGFALNRSQWDQAVSTYGIEPLGAYLYAVQQRQDIASRKAVLLYASQRDAGIKNLELTGLVRYNVEDRSRFVWAEARYHWPRFDLALQWQANLGSAASEYGAVPGNRLVQLLGAFYF
jgi:hypothetical protein